MTITCSSEFVHGHHILKRVWAPAVGELLIMDKEPGNTENQFAGAIFKDDTVVNWPMCPQLFEALLELSDSQRGVATCNKHTFLLSIP